MEKIIGKFRINFNGNFSDKSDKLTLNVKIDNALRTFLKGCCSSREGVQNITVHLGDDGRDNENLNIKRYFIKNPLTASLNYISYFEIVFITNIIDKGNLSLEFNTFEARNNFKEAFKRTVKKLLELNNSERVEETVTFNVKSE